MELTAYVTLAAGAYFVQITRRRRYLYGWFALYVAYSVIVRIMPPAIDMVTYSAAMTVWPPRLTFYTLREPVVWIGVSFLYHILNDRIVTFLIVDVLTGLIVYRALRDLDDGDGRMLFMAPTIMVSYVFLLGQQNVWRQHIALVILLWALASRVKNQRRAILLFILSFLSHNATALLFGYWLDIGRPLRKRYGPLITLASVITILFTLPSLRKSGFATAQNTELLYVALASGMILILLYASTGRLFGLDTPALMNFLAFIPAVVIIESGPFERVSMMFLVLIILDIQRRHQSLHIRAADVQNLATLLLVVPVFLFQSTRYFLLT